jgi:hypothetical protein
MVSVVVPKVIFVIIKILPAHRAQQQRYYTCFRRLPQAGPALLSFHDLALVLLVIFLFADSQLSLQFGYGQQLLILQFHHADSLYNDNESPHGFPLSWLLLEIDKQHWMFSKFFCHHAPMQGLLRNEKHGH